MSQETFINYKRYRWLWITLVALVVLTAVYVSSSPVGGRNGGTTLGYTYGVLATIGIIWLMAYGLRKRAYRSSLGTVEGWLAAHVWIGIGLLLVVPMHSGFSFGCNVHTAAYVFMVVTILTGIWGTANYAALSGKIMAHRGGAKDIALVEQIADVGAHAESLCAGKSDAFLAIFNSFSVPFKPTLLGLLLSPRSLAIDQLAASDMLAKVPEPERSDAMSLLGLLDQRLDMMHTLVEQARIKALLKVWLYVHVPVAFALCVALAIHIFSVFYFW